jgi:hypothetical protein
MELAKTEAQISEIAPASMIKGPDGPADGDLTPGKDRIGTTTLSVTSNVLITGRGLGTSAGVGLAAGVATGVLDAARQALFPAPDDVVKIFLGGGPGMGLGRFLNGACGFVPMNLAVGKIKGRIKPSDWGVLEKDEGGKWQLSAFEDRAAAEQEVRAHPCYAEYAACTVKSKDPNRDFLFENPPSAIAAQAPSGQ